MWQAITREDDAPALYRQAPVLDTEGGEVVRSSSDGEVRFVSGSGRCPNVPTAESCHKIGRLETVAHVKSTSSHLGVRSWVREYDTYPR